MMKVMFGVIAENNNLNRLFNTFEEAVQYATDITIDSSEAEFDYNNYCEDCEEDEEPMLLEEWLEQQIRDDHGFEDVCEILTFEYNK